MATTVEGNIMKNPGELFASTVFLAMFAAAMSAVVDSGLRREPAVASEAARRAAADVDPLRKTQVPDFLRVDSRPTAAAQTVSTPMKDPQ